MRARHAMISGRRRQTNSRRRSEQHKNTTSLSARKCVLHLHHNLQECVSEAWKLLADYLSNIPPRVPVMEDDGARDACNIEFQLKTLNLSHVNLEKCLGQ